MKQTNWRTRGSWLSDYKTNHHEVVVSPEEFFEALPRLVWHEDEPLAHPSSVALYFVSLLASQHVKVVLTGEGSDEILAGYGRYRKTILNLSAGKLYQSLTPWVCAKCGSERSKGFACFESQTETDAKFSQCDAGHREHLLRQLRSVSTRDANRVCCRFGAERIGLVDPYAGVREALEQTDAKSLLDRLLYADIKTYLHELLMKQDQMSMATSIESRVPFLDHKLVEFTCSLPERLKLRGGRRSTFCAKHEGCFAGADPFASEDGISGSNRDMVSWRL